MCRCTHCGPLQVRGSLIDGFLLLEGYKRKYSAAKAWSIDVSGLQSYCPICSAGVGRTGTFITLDVMMERLKERKAIDIFGFVNEMRTRRTKMVQTLVSWT